MSPFTYSFFLSACVLTISLYFIKKRRLEFRNSILWITIAALMIVFSVNRNLIEIMAAIVKISYPPAFLFLTGIVSVLVLIFHLTVEISDLQRKVTKLTQEMGIAKVPLEKEKRNDGSVN